MEKIDLKVLSPKIIGELCHQLHPEALNQIEAMDLHIKYLYQLIQVKLNSGIAAADDIEFYFILSFVKRKLMESLTIESITGPVEND